MNGRIAVVMPSRGRPDLAINAYESMLATSNDADMLLCTTPDQADAYAHIKGERLHVVISPEEFPAPRINATVNRFPGYDIYGTIVDDATFISPMWDEWTKQTIGRFPNGIGVVSAWHNTRVAAGWTWCNFPYVSRKVIETLGWFAFPGNLFYCWDFIYELIGEGTTLVDAGADEFGINHECIVVGDQRSRTAADAYAMMLWLTRQRKSDIAKLKAASMEVVAK